MVNVNKLKGKIIENGLSIETIAKCLEINKSTFYRKLNEKGETFLIKEVGKIIFLLKLTNEEAVAIFFADNVA